MNWDPTTGHFVNNAAELGTADLEALAARSLVYTQGRINTLNEQVMQKQITRQAATNSAKQVLKEEYLRQYMLAVGGKGRMTMTDYGKIGALLKRQYQYLQGYFDLVDKEKFSPKQLNAIARMYANGARNAYNQGKGRMLRGLGYDRVSWVLGSVENHCSDCVRRVALGLVEVGYRGGFTDGKVECWPCDGTSACMANDRCRLVYRNSTTGVEYE